MQGTRVNSGNAADILGDGKVSYDEAANVLTLNNASITNTGGGNDGIQTSIDNLTINLVGNNTITSGDGFGELAVFDLDGNGWIDENDEIFNRLRIWTKDENGDDRLVALGVAGVGAIYLGKAAGEFTFKSQEDNSVLGAVTNTGIFLHENGTAGLVQQIDMASVRTA